MPQRAQLVLREGTTGTNTENLNKGSTLTFEELDRNFLGVRDQTFGIVGDDSTGVDVAAGQTITATGTGGITVSVANDTITIDGSAVSGGDSLGNLEVTGGNSQTISGTVTNAGIIIDPNGTGNIVLSSNEVRVGNTNEDVVIASNGQGDLKIRPEDSDASNPFILLETGQGGSPGTGHIYLKNETNATKGSIYLNSNDGVFVTSANSYTSALTITGNVVANAFLSDGIDIRDNEIIASRSNDNLNISAAGTGKVIISGLSYPTTDGTTGQFLQTNGSGVLSFATATGGISNVVEDTTPQLGGDLDINSNDITGTGNISITGNVNITGNISTDAIAMADNKISTTRSNDDLYVVAAGDGYVHLGKELPASGVVASFGDLPYNTGTFSYAAGNINASSSSSRFYGHQRILDGTVTTGGTNGLVRSRIIDEVAIDVNGLSWNQTSRGGGAGIIHFITVKNTNDGTTGAINWPQGNNSGILLAPSGSASGTTVNISNMAAYRSVSQNFEGSLDTFAITNNYGFYSTPMFDTGPGTVTITNDYSFYADYTNTPRINATNQYAFYSDNDAIANRLGGINFQNDQIQAADTNDDLKIAENGTGKVNMVVTTQGSAGTVAGYMKIKVNGTDYVVPYHNLS